MEHLADLIAEIESRLAVDAYTDGDRNVEQRQSEALEYLVPAGIDYSDAPGLNDLLGDDALKPYAHLPGTQPPSVSASSYSYIRAVKGLSAAAETTAAQYRLTNQSRYSRLMDIVLLELARIVQDNLDQSAAAYQPLTKAFKKSTGELKAAHSAAKSTINALKLASSVISAFGGLIAAI